MQRNSGALKQLWLYSNCCKHNRHLWYVYISYVFLLQNFTFVALGTYHPDVPPPPTHTHTLTHIMSKLKTLFNIVEAPSI